MAHEYINNFPRETPHMQQIKFFFTLQSSHIAANQEYTGSDCTLLEDETFLSSLAFLGYDVVSASVTFTDLKYKVTVEFKTPVNVNEAAEFIEAFASYVTYRLSYGQNHFCGSPFVDIDYGEFYRDNGEGLRDHLDIKVTRKTRLSNFPTTASRLHELVHFYFLGMQSNNVKAKFFNLFLILEAVEASPFSLSLFPVGTLFSEEEKASIRKAASKMGNDKKKGVVQSVLTRTSDSRHNKLQSTLHKIGITHISTLDGSTISIDIHLLKDLIEARNKLFHRGHRVNENLIWEKLIPLTRELVALLIQNPDILDQESTQPMASSAVQS